MNRIIKLLERSTKVRKSFSPARIMILGFMAVILVGALLLKLPFATISGESVPFITALFTATSATGVNGLVVVDTATTWSMFGRVVILCLIQIGGLGFMSVMTIFFFATKKNIGLSQRLLIVQSFSLNNIQGVVKLMRYVLIGTLLFEGIGAIILSVRFSYDYGILKGIGMGVWHSVSAFCNAGFDLMGTREPFSSLTYYSGDVVVLVTIMLLIIIGGLGFFVWKDIYEHKSFRKLHIHSKLVLVITAILIFSGALLIFIAERNNVNTIGNMTLFDKILSSFFQSVSPRTAGFNSISQSDLTDVSKLVTMILMFIGGSPGSTAGGIKTITAGVLILSAISSLRMKNRVSIYERTIPNQQISTALAIMILYMGLCFFSSITITLLQDLPFHDVLFETVSAIGTVGLTTGITPLLSPASQLIIILLMFFGRVGIMTIGMATILNQHNLEKIKFPENWIIMG